MSPEDWRALLCLPDAALEAQADTLVRKRWHEVSRCLPRTFQNADVSRHFRAYADTYWPEGPSRHRLDALAFARYLQTQDVAVVSEEVHLLEFLHYRKRFSLKCVRRRPGLHVLWLRRNKPPAQLRISVGL